MYLSFIVPVYNTSAYLPKCIDSLLHQDIPKSDYQIILVNDGSTDHSLSICETYKEKHDHIILLSQTNSGQSSARNLGMKYATGKYIWFVDSDDYIENNCIQKCLNICDKNQLDILLFCADEIDENYNFVKQLQYFSNSETNHIFQGKDFLASKHFFNCIPFYIYRRGFLEEENISFYEGIYHEDNEVLPKIFYPTKKILGYNQVLYHVHLRPNSTMRSINPKKAFDLIKVARSLLNYMVQNVDKNDYPLFCSLISKAVNASLLNTYILDKKSIQQLKQEWYHNKDIFKWMKQSDVRKYRIESFFFQLFPRHIGWIYRCIKYFTSS